MDDVELLGCHPVNAGEVPVRFHQIDQHRLSSTDIDNFHRGRADENGDVGFRINSDSLSGAVFHPDECAINPECYILRCKVCHRPLDVHSPPNEYTGLSIERVTKRLPLRRRRLRMMAEELAGGGIVVGGSLTTVVVDVLVLVIVSVMVVEDVVV